MEQSKPHTRTYQICNNCIMDTSDSLIAFDESGRCEYCNNYRDVIEPSWHPEIGRASCRERV